MTAQEAAARAATSVQDWAETTVCIMSSRSEGIAHQAKLIHDEFAPLLAAKDAEIDFERGLTDKARETIDRLAAENSELKRVLRRCATLSQELGGDESGDMAKIKAAFDVPLMDIDEFVSERAAELECKAAQAGSDRDALAAENAELKRWNDAIIDASVVGWVYTKEHETDPKRAINDLLCHAQKLALDPAVSPEIAELKRDAERYVELRDGESRFAVADYGDIKPGCALVGGKLDVELDDALAQKSQNEHVSQ